MKISTRNILAGKIIAVKKGKAACAVIKASSVLIGVE